MENKRAWAEINIGNLIHNYQAVRKHLLPECKLMAIVKADAYGHGAPEIAKALTAAGVNALGVATCEEGIELRECGIEIPILLMGFTPEPLLSEVVRHRLIQTVYSVDIAKQLSKTAARLSMRAEVHIQIDTGMGWLGFLADSIEAISEVLSLPSLHVSGIFTHFATSDALDNHFMHEQWERFAWLRTQLINRGLIIPHWYAANSGAFAQTLRGIAYADEHIFSDMVRLGIVLYGLLPSEEMKETCEALHILPVMRLMTQVGMVKTLPAGAGISYGHSFKTHRETRIATLHVGYADGYPRLLSNKATVLINGHYAPIVGAICMDQCMADVTDIPVDVKTGDIAAIFGAKGNTADDLAKVIGTIGYEIVCGIGKRVPRVYKNTKDGKN